MLPINSGKDWSDRDTKALEKYARQNYSTEEIASKLGRTESAVRAKASREDISLEPKDK